MGDDRNVKAIDAQKIQALVESLGIAASVD